MLSFYLAFLYADRPYYNQFLERIQCMAKFLFDVQQKNRLEQKGLLKRFSITCYGHQHSIEEIRAEKAKKYRELKKTKNKKEFEEWFLNYDPEEKYLKTKGNKTKNTTSQKKEINIIAKPRTRKRRSINPYDKKMKTMKKWMLGK